MSDFVWRFVSVVCVSVLAVGVPVMLGSLPLLFGCLLVGGGAVVALFQIGRL